MQQIYKFKFLHLNAVICGFFYFLCSLKQAYIICFTNQQFEQCDIDSMFIKLTYVEKKETKNKSTETQQKWKENSKKLRNITKKMKGFEKSQALHNTGYT